MFTKDQDKSVGLWWSTADIRNKPICLVDPPRGIDHSRERNTRRQGDNMTTRRMVLGRCMTACCLLLLPRSVPAAEAVLPGSIPSIDDHAILQQMPGTDYRMPPRLMTPEFVDKLKRKEIGGRWWFDARPASAARWTKIPDERWTELISDFAPVSMKGCNTRFGGADPFNNTHYFRGVRMSVEDFFETPFQARTVDGDYIVYAREEDMPGDYRWRPNRTVDIPHLDGTVHPYRFSVPDKPEIKDAPPGYNSGRRNWLCPAGEVWRARLAIIMRHAIPELAAAVFWNDDADAEHTLAVILDRIADVYPELPLISQHVGHGFARNRDGSDYLDLEGYRSVEPEMPFPNWNHKPFWFHYIYDYSYGKLNYGIGYWTDGIMLEMGKIARCIDLLRDREGVQAYSRRKYGDPEAWHRKMVSGFLEPARKLAYATPPTQGNTSYSFVKGAVELGLVAQDRYIFERGLSVIEMYVPNNWLNDGMALDGAFNYAGMTYSIIGYRWMNKLFGGLDLNERYPILNRADELGARPVRTLYDIASKHADQHTRFYRSRSTRYPPPAPDAIPYARHEHSQCLPAYGLTCLRGGAPGSRLELIIDHQNTPNHVQKSKMNIQLFYEGVELLPDFGYAVGITDVTREPWSRVQLDYELLGSPDAENKHDPYRHCYTQQPEAHCVATVDHYLYDVVPTTLHAYLGGQPPTDPAYWTQFVDAGGEMLFAGRPNPVDVFRR
ncbi:MAG: hypothetical protein K9N51_00185, partial [Candidatus Pacebacteria bacterium]|nr:hypothetical protein [Candidatus Paceibacterota bacterium]